MNKMSVRVVSLSMIVCMSLLVFFCENNYPPSLFDPNKPIGATPVITEIIPRDSTLAGVGNITIKGQNFSPTIAYNFVYFGSTRAQVISASETELVIKSPNVVGDTVRVKIAVQGVVLFSNTVNYRMKAAIFDATKFGPTDKPWAMTCDAEENLYISLTTSDAGQGVKKITPDGVMSNYAPKGGETYWSALKMGPNGVLYGVRQVRAIFQIASSGATPAPWVTLSLTTAKLADLDFDAELNMWVAGNNKQIFRIKPDKTVTEFPFEANVRSVRIFNNYVYLAGDRGGINKVWRLQLISADQLGPEEEYFDFSTAYSGYKVNAITFAKDGDMYIGTDAPEAIIVVHPDKSYEPLYLGLFKPSSIIFAWGSGQFLYVTREGSADIPQTIIKIQMLKMGAPYFGRGDKP